MGFCCTMGMTQAPWYRLRHACMVLETAMCTLEALGARVVPEKSFCLLNAVVVILGTMRQKSWKSLLRSEAPKASDIRVQEHGDSNQLMMSIMNLAARFRRLCTVGRLLAK